MPESWSFNASKIQHSLRAKTKMEWYAWKYCIQQYKNKIFGIKENNLAFFYNSRLSIKKDQLLYTEPTPIFFSWKKNHNHHDCHYIFRGGLRGLQQSVASLPTYPDTWATELIETSLLLLPVLFISRNQAITPLSIASKPSWSSQSLGLEIKYKLVRIVGKVRATATGWVWGLSWEKRQSFVWV